MIIVGLHVGNRKQIEVFVGHELIGGIEFFFEDYVNVDVSGLCIRLGRLFALQPVSLERTLKSIE